mgnify:CR=1 FL=1
MNTDKPGAPYYQRSAEETLASVQSSPEGISGTEAATRLQQYGENALPQKPGKPAWLRFIAHFNDVLIYVLLAAALLKAVMGHWIDMAVILAVAVVNALIGFIQESNAEKSLQSIRNMLSSEAVVIRQGNYWQPLFCLLPTGLRDDLEHAWQSGERSPQRWFDNLAPIAVDCTLEDARLANLNTPETLANGISPC